MSPRNPLFFSFVLAFWVLSVIQVEKFVAQQAGIVVGTEFGEPIQGITAKEFELFRLGLENFNEVETPDEGLGPVFNGRSCAECHSIPRIGGSSTITEVRGGIRKEDGSFEEYPGGTVMQMFSIPRHETQLTIPREMNVIARRKSLPLFGNGLVEAVPDAVLIALEDPEDRNGDGISGRAHRVHDKASDTIRLGRFGWKAQQATLLAFGAEAYRDERESRTISFQRRPARVGIARRFISSTPFRGCRIFGTRQPA